jgi:HAD superfamily hydrolase (TIGR01509 family)
MNKLIIFDCDGVLVDSEIIISTVLTELLSDVGLSFQLNEVYENFVGYSFAQCLVKIEKMLGKMPPPNFELRYRQETKIALEKNLQPVQGVKKVIQQLELPYCVASSSSHKRMQSTLGVTGLLPYFEGTLFSIEDVSRGKPYPDVYLYAAQKMGFDPFQCIVIEDTPLGVVGGIAAGMTVFGFSARTQTQKLENAGAHKVFDKIDMLLDYI